MPFPTMPDPIADREREEARRHPERETLMLAASGAARGPSRWFGGCMTALRKKTLPRGGRVGSSSSHRNARAMCADPTPTQIS